MFSISNIFPRQPSQPATKVASEGLKCLDKTYQAEARHEVADGFLKTIAKTGSPDEMAFAKTVRAASSKLDMEYQQAELEKLGLQVLAAGVQGSVGLALAQFGKEGYALMLQVPQGKSDQADKAATSLRSSFPNTAWPWVVRDRTTTKMSR